MDRPILQLRYAELRVWSELKVGARSSRRVQGLGTHTNARNDSGDRPGLPPLARTYEAGAGLGNGNDSKDNTTTAPAGQTEGGLKLITCLGLGTWGEVGVCVCVHKRPART